MGQDNDIRWRPVVANTPSFNACWLTRSEADLRARLTELGWKDQTNDFPKIDWSKKVAAVVTAKDKYAQPRRVYPPTFTRKVEILLESDSSHPNSGVLVLELDSKPKSEWCTINYEGLAVDQESSPQVRGRSRSATSKP
jgi:hypothetical protein